MIKQNEMAKVQLSWFRLQWLRLAAVIGDHPKLTIAMVGTVVGSLVFYGTRLGGISHFCKSGARWRVESFGGELDVDRAVRTPDVLLSLKHPKYDRLDVSAPTAIHLGGTAFRKELREMVARGGLLRVAALDPRLSKPTHPEHGRFVTLADAFGLTDWELSARCWHSLAVLLHLEQEFGDAIEIRLISAPAAGIEPPYFSIGRSGHAYFAADHGRRIDVIVPRPAVPTGSDSFTHPGMIIKDRPEHPEVIRFTEAFESTWEHATPMDKPLQIELLKHFDGQDTPRG